MKNYEVPVTFMMGGSYYFTTNNLQEAIRKAEGNEPLPQERSYIYDSLTVDDIIDCMEANGWETKELDTLGRMSCGQLKDLVRDVEDGTVVLSGDGDTSITAARVREYIADYYGADQDTQDAEPATSAVDACEGVEIPEMTVSQAQLTKAETWLKEHGVNDPFTALQELGLILLDVNLYPGT